MADPGLLAFPVGSAGEGGRQAKHVPPIRGLPVESSVEKSFEGRLVARIERVAPDEIDASESRLLPAALL